MNQDLALPDSNLILLEPNLVSSERYLLLNKILKILLDLEHPDQIQVLLTDLDQTLVFL